MTFGMFCLYALLLYVIVNVAVLAYVGAVWFYYWFQYEVIGEYRRRTWRKKK